MNNKSISIALTGHRPKQQADYNYYTPKNLTIATKLREYLLSYLNKGMKVHAISGMALGADTLYALVVLKLKRQGYDISLEAAIPCANHSGKWPLESQQLWQSIVDQADKVTYVSNEKYAGYLMQKRNEYMVDQSSELLAVWDGNYKSGTANCVRYAKKKDKKITQINPNELLIVQKGNLLKSDCDVIMHQANCFSTMGAGIAKQIKMMYPSAYAADQNTPMSPDEKLGNYTYSKEGNVEIVNLYGQYSYGGSEQQTDYISLKYALYNYLKDKSARDDLSKLKIGVPKGMGCGLAGGDWVVVSNILEQFCKEFHTSIYAYQI